MEPVLSKNLLVLISLQKELLKAYKNNLKMIKIVSLVNIM